MRREVVGVNGWVNQTHLPSRFIMYLLVSSRIFLTALLIFIGGRSSQGLAALLRIGIRSDLLRRRFRISFRALFHSSGVTLHALCPFFHCSRSTFFICSGCILRSFRKG